MAKEVNLDAFADKIASKLLAARQQANEAGEEVGEEFVEGVVKGIQEHSKDAKSEIAKLFEEFNKVTNNFKTRKSINNSDWNRVLGMSKELMKSERYADAVLDKLSDISVTFKNIGKTSGIANVLKELEKGATIESVAWSEASKNYKPKKKPASRPSSKSVDVASAFTQLSNLSEDPYLIKEEEKINNIYQKRLAIIKKIGEAKLKEHDVDAYEAEMNINSEYQSRLDGFKEQRDNDIYDKLGDQLGYYNDRLKSSLELEELLAERRKAMKDVHFKGDDSYKYEVKVNKELEKRIELMKSLEGLYKNGLISKDDMESMMYERGTIDERRSALDGVFQDVFNRYDKDASRQDNLDDAQFILDQLGFSKIGITTGGGKKIEIGPEMSMVDYETFMKMNIESARSIEFVRKETQMTIGVMEDQAKAVNEATKAADAAAKTVDKQGEAIENTAKKSVNMEAVIKRYNKLMNDIGVEHLTIGTRFSQDTDDWGLKEMVQEAKYQLENYYNPEHDSYMNADGLTDDVRKRLQSEVGRLKRFIAAYEPYVDMVESTVPVSQSAAEAAEKQTLALQEQAEVAKNVAQAQEHLDGQAQETAEDTVQSNQKKITSYQELLGVLQEYFDLTKQTAKSQLDGSFIDEFEKVMPDYSYSDLESPEKRLSEIMENFKKTYKMLSGMKKAQKDGIDFIDTDNIRIDNERLGEEIDYATTKLAAMARVYMDLGGSFGDFNKTQQKIVTPKLVRYDKDSEAFKAEGAELDKINAPIEAAQNKIRELLQSMLPTLDGTEQLAQMMTGRGPWGTYTETISRLNANAGIFDMIEPERAAKALASVFGIEIPKAIEKAEIAQSEFTAETEDTAIAQDKIKASTKDTLDALYHAGDLSNINGTLKSFPLGNVPPTRSNGIGGLTGLYTTDDLDGFIGNEWQGAPISTIDPSLYKFLNIRSNEVADKVGEFLNDINATIYGYYNAIDEKDWSLQRHTDVKSIDELYTAHLELFAESGLSLDQFTQFINNAKEKIVGKSFTDIELPAIDEGIAKSGISSAIQGATEELFNSDSFQTQFLKMLGYEGVDLRGTKYNGTYTGGSVIFDVKPESISATNEKWSDVMARNGYEVTEDDLKYEEKRRQLAFDTAKAYSKQADAVNEVRTDTLQDTFDVMQQGESITGKFVTTANTAQEALQKMRMALPEEQKGWGDYIDQLLTVYDNKYSMENKLAEMGSMGDASEQYRIENLGDGKMAVTFSGIAGQIEEATTAIEEQISAEKELLSVEEKVSAERDAQFQAYAYAATNLLSAGYESIPSDIQAKLFTDFSDKIVQDGMSASDAMDQLYISLESLKNQSKEMPDDVIENFSAESEKVAETVTQLKKLSSIDLTRIFDSVDLKSFLEAFNIDKSNFATFRSLFEELMQITNAIANGVDVGNAFDLKMEEITSTIMKLGGYMVDLDDGSYATMIQDFYKHMSNTKVQFNDTIKADYTKDQWKSLYGTYKNRLTADLTKGIPADSLYQELSGLFPSLFPEGVLSQQDQFKLIFNKLDEARQLQANNWKTLHGFVSSDRDAIQLGVDDMYNHMSDALFAGSSADAMTSEADAAKDVAQSMNNAADAKGKFANANKKVGDSANASADQLTDEASAIEKVATSAEELPAGDIVTKLFIGENDDPSGAIVKQMRMVGDKMQTEAKRLAANEEGGWDVTGSTITEQKIRGMQEYIKAYRQEANKLNGIQANIRALGDDGMSADLTNKVKSYTVALEKMNVAMKELQANPSDPVASMKFDDATRDANKARAEIEGIFKESQKLSKIGQLKIVGEKDVSKVENLKAAMIEFANSTWDGEAKITGFNKKGTEMYVALNQGAGAVENITVALDKASGHLQAFTTGTSKATNEWEDFKTQAIAGAKNIAGMYVGFQEGVQAARKGVEYVKEIDLAMTELKKVTDETDASYKEFLKDAGSTSAVIGSTISDFTEATATFARLGYSMEESSSMAETAIIYKNVADGLDSVEESSDSIISTMMAFGIEANDTMSIIDRFNAVGNNFAITSAGIGEALQRSASALYSAGNTIDESVALVTAANSVIQNPEQVGTALKTLALRLRGAKVELEEAGLETDNMAESTSTLQAKLNALTHGKVDIMLDADTFKSTTQILREMSAAWEDMTDIERASALELMGGKRQAKQTNCPNVQKCA